MSASNDFKIQFLRIKNYRQYYGEQKIDLSSSDCNINIIQGENGEGKSNILNAINYCLYMTEPHLKKGSPLLPIINLKAIREAPIGSNIDMEIELELGTENIRHRIRRAVHIKRAELQMDESEQSGYEVKSDRLGTFPINSSPWDSFEIKSVERKNGNWVPQQNTDSFIQEKLPKGLTSFYFLDGEFLESLHLHFDKIKDGIKEISQLNLVFFAIDHTKALLRSLENETKGQDPDIDRYQDQVNQYNEWLDSTDGAGNKKYSNDVIWWKKPYDPDNVEYHPDSGRPRLSSRKEEEEVLKEKIAKIEQYLAEHNASNIRSWSTELARLEDAIEHDESYCDKKNREKMNHIATIGPEIYLTSCIQSFIKFVDEKRSKGELPVKWTEIFVEDLLEHNRCICGNDLTSATSKETLLEWREKSKKSEQLDITLEATVDFKARKSKLKENFSKIDRLRREIHDCEMTLKKNRVRRKELQQNLKNVDESNIRDLMSEKEARKNMLEEVQRDIAILEDKLETTSTKLGEANNHIKKLETKTKQLRQKRSTISFCRCTLEHLETIRDNVLNNMRIKVANHTRENFLNLIWKKNEFTDVNLTNDYQLIVLKNGFNAVHTLSAGERLVLALSFIVAIRTIVGFRVPLIIDTPLGKISGKPTKNIANFISDFSNDVQITLLVTDKEYQFMDPEIGRSFRDLIKKFVNKEYILNRHSQEDTTVRVMK